MISGKTDAILLAKYAIDELVYVINYVKDNLIWDNGEAEIVKMGSNLSAFSSNIVSFANDFALISGKTDAILLAKNAVETLVGMVNYVKENLTWDPGKAEIVKMGNDLSELGADVASFSQNMGDSASLDAKIGSLRSIVKFANSVADVDFDGFKNLGTALEKLGKDGVKKFVKSFSNSDNDIKSAVTTMINTLVNKITSELDDVKKAGSKTTKKYAEGIDDNKTAAKKAINTVTSSVIERIEAKHTSFYSAGEYVVEGFADGMTDSKHIATAAARAVAAAAIEAAEEEAGIQSPSKEFYGMGYYCVAGFANAMYDYQSMTYSAGSDMADSARSGLSDALSRVNDYLNGEMDMQPTIRPVLDLSDVRSGVGTISDLMRMGSSIDVLSNLGSINTIMNRRNQNGANDDVVDAIGKLRKDLGNVNNTSYNINGITYNADSDVGEAIETLIRAIRVEGRV